MTTLAKLGACFGGALQEHILGVQGALQGYTLGAYFGGVLFGLTSGVYFGGVLWGRSLVTYVEGVLWRRSLGAYDTSVRSQTVVENRNSNAGTSRGVM